MELLPPTDDNIRKAAQYIRNGKLVAFPTETVYGLGADALNPFAVREIFRAKGRPSDNPLIVHVSSVEQAELLFSDAPELFYTLSEKFWPGPLTMVVERSSLVPKTTTGGRESVAIRMPSHRIALKLIEYANTPIAAPSANKSGRPSPTHPSHVLEDFKGEEGIILDGGTTLHGIESTVISLLHDPPMVLRLGALDIKELERYTPLTIHPAALGKKMDAPTPGAKYKHYSPSVPLILVEGSRDEVIKIYEEYKNKGKTALLLLKDQDPQLVAKNLYKTMRELEKEFDFIIVEAPRTDNSISLAVLDRLRKAATLII